jgi:LPXTG-motif cell wall-anchored protein
VESELYSKQDYLIFGNGDGVHSDYKFGYNVEKYGSADGSSDAIATFELNAGETVTLQGIPVESTVTITETTGKGYTTTYTYNGVSQDDTKTITISSLIEQDTTVTCNNEIDYTLPKTGGDGNQIYTYGGLSIIAFAVVCGTLLMRRGKGRRSA